MGPCARMGWRLSRVSGDLHLPSVSDSSLHDIVVDAIYLPAAPIKEHTTWNRHPLAHSASMAKDQNIRRELSITMPLTSRRLKLQITPEVRALPCARRLETSTNTSD